MTQTRTIATFGDNGEASFQVDYDDVTLLVLAFRCINPTASKVFASISQISTGKTYSEVFPANATTEQTIPPGQANQILIAGFNPTGKWLDVRFSFTYPYLG